jgi:hypothetical protein
MSWGAVPWWVYAVEFEEYQARMLGAFPEELSAGFVRGLPEHVVKIIQRERNYEEDSTEFQSVL